MASRNKKGKLHGIFKSQFQISFFYKPSMEGMDIYYYLVLEEILFLKVRFVENTVLIIEDITPLTASYMEKEYERLFTFLKEQTSITVLVSLIGNLGAFRQTCVRMDAPLIEDERFIAYPEAFYQKYKNYCGNDVSRFGFFLLALNEDSFKEPPPKEESTPMEEPSTPLEELSMEHPEPEEEIKEPQEEKVLVESKELSLEYDLLNEWAKGIKTQLKDEVDVVILPSKNLEQGDGDCRLQCLFGKGEEETSLILSTQFRSIAEGRLELHIFHHLIPPASIIWVMDIFRQLVTVVNTYKKRGLFFQVAVTAELDSILYQMLSDLQFHPAYDSGNCIVINDGRSYKYANTSAIMVYTPF